uniref:Uncharacterized protein n=1 Tax=Arundo donax TaxID=35708 RepID=A0A0A9A3D5_ARUDO
MMMPCSDVVLGRVSEADDVQKQKGTIFKYRSCSNWWFGVRIGKSTMNKSKS